VKKNKRSISGFSHPENCQTRSKTGKLRYGLCMHFLLDGRAKMGDFGVASLRRVGMPKAAAVTMNYYEKLIKKMNQSMKEHPRSAMVMDMGSFEIVAKGSNIKSLRRKLAKTHAGVIFQKPSDKAAWIL
jgi:hypothetical protein